MSCKSVEGAVYLFDIRQSSVTCLTPAKFDILLTAVRGVCGFDNELHSYKLPSGPRQGGVHGGTK